MSETNRKQSSPKLVNLIQHYLVGLVIGVAVVIAVLGYFGLEQVYESANQNLEEAIRNRYKAEIQHVVETVAAAIESTVAGEIGPKLAPDQQEEVKRIIRGAKFDTDPKTNRENGYFFLYDMEGRSIAHGAHPKNEGQNLMESKDPYIKSVIQQLRTAAQLPDTAPQSERFVEYEWEKPGQSIRAPKISYTRRLRGDQWWLGAGVYVDEIKQTLRSEREKQQTMKWKAEITSVLFLCAMVVSVYKLSGHISGKVTRPVSQLVESVQRVSQGDYTHPVVLADPTDETQVLSDAFDRMVENINAHVSALTRAQEEAKRLLALNRELTSNELEKVEEERHRIARDLHDDIKQKLWILRTKLDAIGMAGDVDAQQGLLIEAIAEIKRMSQAVRAIIQNLRSPALNELGLLPALRELCESLANSASLTLYFDSQHKQLRLPPNVEIVVYRIVQEAMMNVARHARAHCVDVWLACNQGMLEIRMQDDGQGFDVKAAMQRVGNGQSMGLLNMTERVRSIDGEILFECPATGGTTVTVKVPMPHGEGCDLNGGGEVYGQDSNYAGRGHTGTPRMDT